jgi:opacity protein-like surface antigen
MGGKVGFGLGITQGSSVLNPDYLAMKIGIMPMIAIEPTIDFDKYSDDNKIDSIKTNNMDIGLGLNLILAFARSKSTNIYGFGGLGFGIFNHQEENYSSAKTKTKNSGNIIGIPLGLGLEHFITETFSIDLRAVSGLLIGSNKTEYTEGNTTTTTNDISSTDITFSNVRFETALFWYF